MRNYTAKNYKELVTNIDDETLQRFMRDEQSFVAGVEDAKSRTFVDLGAGYGRAVPYLSKIGNKVIAIEINPGMTPQLHRLSTQYENVTDVEGNFFNLRRLVPKDLMKPVFLLLQNTTGTPEGGSPEELLVIVHAEAQKANGTMILSLFRQPALADWGIQMYNKVKDMAGEPDLEKTDTEKGLFVSKTGYTSKWWTDKEIEQFKGMGKVVREEVAPEFALIELEL